MIALPENPCYPCNPRNPWEDCTGFGGVACCSSGIRANTTKLGQCIGLVTINLQRNPAGYFFTFADGRSHVYHSCV